MNDTRAIVANGTNDLICAVCFADNDGEASSPVGICKVCKFYVCGKCAIAHQRHEEYRTHPIAFFYCAQKLRINRYMRANSFCLDCSQYLCNKCVIDHAGYWVYRHHTFIGGGTQLMEELPVGYKQTPPSRSSRRLTTMSTQRSNQQDGNKSPYALHDSITTPTTPKESITRHTTPKSNITRPTTPKSNITRPTTPKTSITRQTTPKESITRHSTPKESITRHTTQKESITKHTTQKESITRHTTPKESLTRHTTPKESITRHTTPNESITGHTTPKESILRHTTPKESITGHTTPMESIIRHATPKESITRHTTQRESIPGQTTPKENITSHTTPKENITSQITPKENITMHATPKESDPTHSIPKLNIRKTNTPKKTTRPRSEMREVEVQQAPLIYSATLPRTLIQSNVGKRSENKRGNLKNKETTAKPRKRPKSVQFEDDNLSTVAKLQGEFALKAPEDERPNKIIAMVYLFNGKLAMVDAANKSIKLFDKRCNYMSSLKLGQLPISICASETGPVEMFASGGNQIHEIQTEHGMDILQSFETRIPRIEGITRWASGVAAIFRSAKSSQDKKGHWEVHLMSKEGIVKFEIAISTPLDVKLVTPIWYISSNEDGDELFISDTHNNRILCIDVINWHVVYVIKGKDTSGSPRSIATDGDGNALVVWYNEVHRISEFGEDLGVAVSDLGKGSVIAYNPGTQTLAVWSDRKAKLNKFRTYQMK